MRKCLKCGLPENFQGIIIHEDNECNYCKFYEKQKEVLNDNDFLHERFVEQLNQAKAKAKENNAEYDCLVGLSGGKDSTYIIYQLKHRYNMRVLAFTYDNGFATEYGRTNIQIALDKLNVDHISFAMNREKLRKYNQMCTSLFKNFCMMCFHLTHYYSHQIAAEKNIPLIVNGRTKGQILQFADSTHLLEPFEYTSCFEEYEYQMFKKSAEKTAKLCRDLPKIEGEVRALSYFMYHDYDPQEVMDFLEERLGWVKPKAGVAHADCWAHPVAEQLQMGAKAYPIMTGELAYMVRSGEISKEEAQRRIEKESVTGKTVDNKITERFNKEMKMQTKEEDNAKECTRVS